VAQEEEVGKSGVNNIEQQIEKQVEAAKASGQLSIS
jgi:hypothetical protein